MRWLITVVLTTLVSMSAVACDDDEAELVDPPGDIGPETELAYEGTVYKPAVVVPRSEIPDEEFTQIGTAEKLSIPFESVVPIYAREGDDDAELYTPDLTVDPDGAVGQSWVGWLPHDEVEDPGTDDDVVIPGEDDADGDGGSGDMLE